MDKYLPVSNIFYLKPAIGVAFILHVMLLRGGFETVINLMMQETIWKSSYYCGLIGKRYIKEPLVKYSNTYTKIQYRTSAICSKLIESDWSLDNSR